VLRPGRREHFTLLEVVVGCGCWIGGGGGGGGLVWGGRGKGGEWMMQLRFIVI
jgi:hypothetical protein